MSAGIDAYRLTEADEVLMVGTVRDLLKRWVREHDGAGWYGATDHEALERVAAHAIGCSFYDLRDVELEWITRTVALIAADVFAGSSEFASWKVGQ